MHLSSAEFELFRTLQSALSNFIYAKLQAARGLEAHLPFRDLPLAKQLEVREAFATDHSLIDQFIVENPGHLSYDELEVVGSWRQLVRGKFYIARHLKKYTVFLAADESRTAYGVVGLTQPIADVMGTDAAILVEAILLPFQDRIVYDGLLQSYPLTFGPGLRRALNDDYRAAKEQGILTSLAPASATSATAKPARPKAAKPKAKPRRQTT